MPKSKHTPELKDLSNDELVEADRALYRRQGTARTVIGFERDGRVVSKGGAYHDSDVMVSRDAIRAEIKRRNSLLWNA